MESPKDPHWKVGKRISRYVAGTVQHEIQYTTSKVHSLVGYRDSDFTRSIDDIKRTSHYAFHLRTSLISWASKKHPIVTISSAKEV